MRLKLILMRIFLLIAILSLAYANTSFQGFLLPSSNIHLMSNDNDYLLSKRIVLESIYAHKISSHYIALPNSINTGVLECSYKINSYNASSSLSIINYGNFDDSESGYTFSSKDYIAHHRLDKSITNHWHTSFDLKYIYSKIDTYNANAIATKFSVYYHNQRFLAQVFIDNYGFVIDNYTNFDESLPVLYGYKIMLLPKYINAIISAKHDYFDNDNIIHFTTELFLFEHSSILFGFSSLSKDLYYGDFNNDFFIGVSIGLSTRYDNYLMNLGFKNLGALGLASSFTISRSIN